MLVAACWLASLKYFFSNPFDRSTPSHRCPGARLYLRGQVWGSCEKECPSQVCLRTPQDPRPKTQNGKKERKKEREEPSSRGRHLFAGQGPLYFGLALIPALVCVFSRCFIIYAAIGSSACSVSICICPQGKHARMYTAVRVGLCVQQAVADVLLTTVMGPCRYGVHRVIHGSHSLTLLRRASSRPRANGAAMVTRSSRILSSLACTLALLGGICGCVLGQHSTAER